MVAWFHGPMILENRCTIDPAGFILEFDAEIPVKTILRDSMKAKLQLHNTRRYCFEYAITQVVAAVTVSTLAILHNVYCLLMDPKFARLVPHLADQVKETNFTNELKEEKFTLFGDIVSVRHILYYIQPIRVK